MIIFRDYLHLQEHIARGFRFLPHFPAASFICADCNEPCPLNMTGNGGTGYAVTKVDEMICYNCCGKRDLADAYDTGHATLYLSHVKGETRGHVSNWPGTFTRPCQVKQGRHNIARVRYDVWFTIERQNWHGVQYGDNTQICHCRKVNK